MKHGNQKLSYLSTSVKNKPKPSMYTLNCKGRLFTINKPIVMGIVNVTPDSFYNESRQQSTNEIINVVEKMIADGASIIDIGGQSTRPGSDYLPAEKELARVLPAIEAIITKFPELIISIDTFHAEVARQAVMAGASIVNDISAGTLDPFMIETVAALKVPYIVMHMKGTPGNMQQNAVYEDVTKEVLDYFIFKIEECRKAGIIDIIIDPGFGFAKTISHNFTLLNHLKVFQQLQLPILAGLSRKATIYKTLGTTASEALNGTTVLNTIALQNGAAILRVHDVKEALETIKLLSAYHQATG